MVLYGITLHGMAEQIPVSQNHPITPQQAGIAGEYFVAAELTRRGHIASITLRNTRGVDMLATNADATRTITLQCKSTQRTKPVWVLGEKNERSAAPNHFFVFVILGPLGGRPAYYIVPSEEVARYISSDYSLWKQTPGRDGRPHGESLVRQFRDPTGKYLERWDLLGL